jgi:anti-sigma factor RsiW
MASWPFQQLLGYLLGALEDDEQAAVEEQLRASAKLRKRLATLRKQIQLLQGASCEFDPPPGLARRTCHFIAAFAEARSGRPAEAEPPRATTPLPAPAQLPSGGFWRWSDVSMMAAIVVTAVLLIFPAIESSRFRARVMACQDNLQQLGTALVQYSEHHGKYFPQVPQQGNLAAAGIYAPTLLNDGLLDSPQRVVCPGSSLAADRPFQVPSLGQLQAATGRELARLRSMMGGSYGYSLGYVEDGRYVSTRNLSRPTFALMADAPSDTLPGFQSENHGGQGQNVLFEDGHVRFLTSSRPIEDGDDVFVNDTGLVAAGDHRNDSVVAGSAAAPLVFISTDAQ